MSGHSHWSKIRRSKGLADAKKGKVFSKMAKLISVAAREGGDSISNSKLRLAIEKAKTINLPKENIERAIKRGTGEVEGAQFEEVLFEAYGPGKIAIIIEGITDNKNRALAEIKQILTQNKAKLVGEGSVKWLFERKGMIIIYWDLQIQNFKNKEELELLVIESGAEDIYWHNNILDVYTKIEDLEVVKKNLEKESIKIESASLDWIAKEMIEVEKKDKEACEKLFDALDENDAVQEIYSNIKV